MLTFQVMLSFTSIYFKLSFTSIYFMLSFDFILFHYVQKYCKQTKFNDFLFFSVSKLGLLIYFYFYSGGGGGGWRGRTCVRMREIGLTNGQNT